MTSRTPSTTGATPRRRAASRDGSQPAAAPVDIASVTATEPVESAADRGTASDGADPTYDEIAQAAYQRYLSRGATNGRDFDDWIEAERELRSRRSR